MNRLSCNPIVMLVSLGLVSCAGCTSSDESTELNSPVNAQLSAFDAAQNAMNQERWAEADRHIQKALLESPGDSEVLQLAADVAFANKRHGMAVSLIADAAIADQFEDPGLVQRATVGFIAVGKLYEAIDLLDQVIERYPERHETRRFLFDFLINAEEHHRAVPHGRILVRERKFDRVLLFSLGTTEQRDMEGESMVTLYKRNPSDPRLKIGVARAKFDKGQWEELEQTLLEILEHSPRNVPAQYLLGRYLVESGQVDRLDEWTGRLTPEVEETWQYWSVLGDWAFAKANYRQAVRAYWESTRRNLDIGEVWAKLARTLLLLSSQGEEIDRSIVDVMNSRAELLGRFMQDKERFYKLGNRSNAVVADMAESLFKLGRYWEAEAWTSFALTIPDKDVEVVKAMRQRIVRRLTTHTPWQLADGHPVVALDLRSFPKPSLEQLAEARLGSTDEALQPSVRPVLRDESELRGLRADDFSPTSRGDEVIPIYAQMESGGCAIDFDRDGWPDLYVASGGGNPSKQDSRPNHLYRNLGGQFIDVTDLSETNDHGFSQGVTFGDVNEDGFHDIVVLNYGLDRLLLNNGDGTFSDRTQWLANNDASSWSTSGAIADLNGDGLSDLVRLKYCAGMDPVKIACHVGKTDAVIPCPPTRFNAERDVFSAGTPSGGFEDVTDRWSASPLQLGRGLGVVVGSLDASQGIDVFVANDMTNNHFWSPSVGDSFSLVESATLRGLAFDARFRPQACMGIATADFDCDADIDFFVTNFEQEHNAFYEQADAGIWSDRTAFLGLMDASFFMLGFGTQAIDFDNDAQLEVAITNGHVYKDTDPPATYAQKMQVIRRVSTTRYDAIDFSSSEGYLSRDHVGRAMWTIDADRDGRMDLAITHQTEPLALLMNQTPCDGHWIKVRLVGVDATRDPVGAKVTIRAGNLQRMAPLVSGDGFYCRNQGSLHFGLGAIDASTVPVTIDVTWPDGTGQQCHARADREYLIVQGRGEAFDISH